MKSNLHDLPLYKQIELKLVEDIAADKYLPGERIPTQQWFVETYGVSRVTVRKAMNELIEKNILISKKGGGTYVSDVQEAAHSGSGFISNINRLGGFTNNLNRNGQAARSIILEMSVIECDKHLSDALYVSIGSPAVRLLRLRLVNDVPVSVELTYINKQLVPQLDFLRDFADNMSLYEFLVGRGGVRLSHASENIFAVNAPPRIAGHLEIRKEMPILFVKRKLFTETENIIEYCEIHCRTDIYKFSVDYPA